MRLTHNNDGGRDAVMWLTAPYDPLLNPNFAIRITASVGNNEQCNYGYAIFFADTSSRVIPPTNGASGEQFGVDWGQFSGMAIFGGTKSLYRYFTIEPTSSYKNPGCSSTGSLAGLKCGAWKDAIPGKVHSLIVAIEDTRYLRVTVCTNGQTPCVAAHSFDYILPTPLVNLTGPVYFGIAGRTVENTGNTYVRVKKVDFYTPTVTCPDNCHGQGYCMADSSCKCHTGFAGSTCETPVCDPACTNGGTCVAPNRCMCVSGYGGADCSEGNCVSNSTVVVTTTPETLNITNFPVENYYDGTECGWFLEYAGSDKVIE